MTWFGGRVPFANSVLQQSGLDPFVHERDSFFVVEEFDRSSGHPVHCP